MQMELAGARDRKTTFLRRSAAQSQSKVDIARETEPEWNSCIGAARLATNSCCGRSVIVAAETKQARNVRACPNCS
jgi:hypothetical protein